jgi:hypothetical protein
MELGADPLAFGVVLSGIERTRLMRQEGCLLKRIKRSLWFAFVRLTLLLALSLQAASAAVAPQGTDPIRLPLTFVQSNPVTTITVGGQAVQAIVDISGGDADGALTLSKEVIESVDGLSLGTAVANDALGHEFTRPRFKVSSVTIGGHTFQDIRVVQAQVQAAGEGPPVPNAIGKHFLSQYFVVVDYAGASISLWPPDTKNPAGIDCGRTRIPMEPTKEARLAVSDFDTPSGRVRLLWGTGNTYSMLPETVAENLRLPTVTRGPNTPDFYQSKMLSAAGQDLGPLEFVVLPLKLPSDFEGILGGNFFEHHVVCLDYKRREIRVR